MAPKRKTQCLSTEAKSKKKPCVSKTVKDSNQKNIPEVKKNTGKKIGINELNEAIATKVKIEETSPMLVEENPIVKPTGSVNLVLNQLIQKKSMLNMQGNIGWKAYVFPSVTNLGDDTVLSFQYFGLDLIDVKSERTFWTHKPSVWQYIFETVPVVANEGQIPPISSIFNGVLARPVRDPKDKNKIKTFQTKSHQTIQHWIMLVPMPADIVSSEYINIFINKFQKLCQRSDIKSAYYEGVRGISSHSGMLSQVDDQGNYWNVIANATEKEISIKFCACLSEVLMDDNIKEVVEFMFGGEKSRDGWPSGIETFAYGEK